MKTIYSIIAIVGIPLMCSFFLNNNNYHQVLVEKEWGGGRFDALNAIQEDYLGNFVVVGQSKSRSEGKEDFYIAITDPLGNLIKEKKIGRRKKDIANAVALSNDGGYVIAGYTESEGVDYKGGQDAVLVKLDENLKDVWFESGAYSTGGDELFNHIIAYKNDTYIATGVQDGKLYSCMIDANGKQIWTHKLHDYSYSEGASIVVTSNGNIAITGAAKKDVADSQTSILVITLSPKGKPIWYYTYFSVADSKDKIRLINGNSIIELPNGNLAIGGTINRQQFEEDMAILVVSSMGDQLFAVPYGFKAPERCFGITQNYNNEIYLAGVGAEGNGKRSDGWIVKANASDGSRLWKSKYDNKNLIGTGRNDEIKDVTHTSDGSIVMVGMKKSGFKSGQAWFYKLKPEIPNDFIPASTELYFEQIELFDADRNKVLTSGEGGYLKVPLKNKSGKDCYNLSLRVDLGLNDANLQIPEKVVIGSILANSTKYITIPIFKSDTLYNSNTPIKFIVHHNSDKIKNGPDYQINTSAKVEAILAFNNLEFVEIETSGFQRGSRIRLVGNIVNKGNIKADKVSLSYELPYRVLGISELNQDLGSLDPGDSRRINIEFKPDYSFLEQVLNIDLKAMDVTGNAVVQVQHSLEMEEQKILPQFVSGDLSAQFVGGIDTREIVVNKAKFTLPINLFSNQKINSESFKLWINNTEEYPLDRRVQTYIHDPELEDKYQFQYQNLETFLLKKGINEVKLEVTTTAGTIETKTVKITYEPHQPALHLVSIGVPIDQIKEYATNDATDFAKTFGEAGKSYFKSIHSTIKNDKKGTFDRPLARTFYDLKKAYFSGQIKSDDLVIVFISSHATITTPGTFKIKASNFDGFYPDLTSIDYVENIERFLGQINCQKMILLDVFNELDEKDNDEDANAKDEPELSNEFLRILADNPNSTPVLMSCGPGTSSVECPLKEKGLFAHSIFEALRIDQPVVADINSNNVITVNEFYDYLRTKASTIAASTCNRNNAPEPYSPNLNRFASGEDYTLLYAHKYD